MVRQNFLVRWEENRGSCSRPNTQLLSRFVRSRSFVKRAQALGVVGVGLYGLHTESESRETNKNEHTKWWMISKRFARNKVKRPFPSHPIRHCTDMQHVFVECNKWGRGGEKSWTKKKNSSFMCTSEFCRTWDVGVLYLFYSSISAKIRQKMNPSVSLPGTPNATSSARQTDDNLHVE